MSEVPWDKLEAAASVATLVLSFVTQPFIPSIRLLVGGLLIGLAIGFGAARLQAHNHNPGSRMTKLTWLACGLVALSGLVFVLAPRVLTSSSPGSSPVAAKPQQPASTPSPTSTANSIPSPTSSPTSSPATSTLPPGVPPAEFTITDHVTISISDVKPTDGNAGSSTDITVLIANNSSTPFRIEFSDEDVSITDDVKSQYDTTGNWYFSPHDSVVNSGLPSKIYISDLSGSDKLSPNATFLIVKFKNLSGFSNVAVSYRLK